MRFIFPFMCGAFLCAFSFHAFAQSLGSAGTIEGTVTDATGGVVPRAAAAIVNSISGYRQSTEADSNGKFRFTNVPPNDYRLQVSAPGFATSQQDVSVRSSVPIGLDVRLAVAGSQTTVEVQASGSALAENVAYAHNDVDQSTLARLPALSPGSGLSDAIVLSTPGVVADSNGFFHPLGDHAQTSFVVDGQTIADQQSKAFSTQLPVNAFQSMELITGLPQAEYGDKTSLVVNSVTRSGLGKQPFGAFEAQTGSFRTYSENASLGLGARRFGNFLVLNSIRSGRFLDTPEFFPAHDIGNSETFFDRIDWQPSGANAFHLNLFAARNWFQIPNTYDQAGQDQRQKVVSLNLAPGYQHTFSANSLLTINPWVRRDFVSYYPSADPFNDLPATLAQNRHLLNYGVRGEFSYVHGRHNLKLGTELKQTRLFEAFSFALTDPAFNAVCLDAGGNPQALPAVTDPGRCGSLGFQANPSLAPGLVPFDLTRGGGPFRFSARGHVNQYAFYAQDTITISRLTINGGLRLDEYNGVTQDTAIEPRIGVSWLMKRTGTVLRASYARTFETPYNENLLLSSASGSGGLATNVFGAFGSVPLKPGDRNQYNTGLEQPLGRFLLIGADYFWKYTDNAYDFDVLFNTPVAFPIAWRKSKLDGVSARISTTDLHGFQAYVTMGHTRARFFGPETGGLIFNSPVNNNVFRIDHDQAFQSTANFRYQRPHNGAWVDLTWRYDSGEVAGHVPDLASALGLTADQQAAIGFFCGSQRATLGNPITACGSASYGAARLRIPAAGTGNDDTNPPRVAPRNVFDLSAGTDNLLHREGARVTLRLSVLNLTNVEALYNFLSTFSGTHFVTPRSYNVALGFVF